MLNAQLAQQSDIPGLPPCSYHHTGTWSLTVKAHADHQRHHKLYAAALGNDLYYTQCHAQAATLEATVKRFKKCYHPAMSAALVCDPAFHIASAECDGYIANEQRIAAMAIHLKIDVWADATKVLSMLVCNATA